MKALLFGIAVAALAGNLLVPESVLRYHACCFDSAGKLNSDCSHNKCCDPEKVQLREAPPSDVNTAAGLHVPAPSLDLAPNQLFSFIQTAKLAVVVTCVSFANGPPGADVLIRHSRLNT